MKTDQKLVPLKVFIVDDSVHVVERLRMLFHDYSNIQFVGSANSIATALVGIEVALPGVILIDINLKEDSPEANGTDLLSVLRKIYPSKCLIMLSNLSSPHYVKKCNDLGADYFLDKSNEFDKIPEILNRIHSANADAGPVNFNSL